MINNLYKYLDLNHPPVTKYKPEERESNQRFANISMGVGEREFTYIPNKKSIPGPASYGIQTGKIRSWSVPKNDPKKRVEIERVPGPGTYELIHDYKKHDWDSQRLKAIQYKEIRRPKHIELHNSESKYKRSETPN